MRNMVEREWELRRCAERALWAAENPRLSRAARKRQAARAQALLDEADAVRALRARLLGGRRVA